MNTTLKAALSFSLVWPHFVYSDELDDFRHFYGDEQTVGIATGYARPLAESPSVVTVIAADDIKKRGGCLHRRATGNGSGIPCIFGQWLCPGLCRSRDLSPLSSHVLVMQDGVPVNDPVNSGKLFSYTHLTKNISRIEIIRGPGSALYGADAFAGVINIITKTGQEIGGGEIGALAGSFDSYGGWALLGKQFGDFDLAFSAQGRTTKGQRETVKADAQTRMDRLFNTQASLAPGRSMSRVTTSMWVRRYAIVTRSNCICVIRISNPPMVWAQPWRWILTVRFVINLGPRGSISNNGLAISNRSSI